MGNGRSAVACKIWNGSGAMLTGLINKFIFRRHVQWVDMTELHVPYRLVSPIGLRLNFRIFEGSDGLAPF